MAKLTIQGTDEYLKQLQTLGKDADGMIKRAVYEGASVVLDAIEKSIESLPTHDFVYVYNDQDIRALTPAQKQGLLDGLGAAKMRNDNGFINTKVGFDGYNSVKTKKYPKGQPNSLIARAMESGSSVRPKTRFVTNAVKPVVDRAEQAMANSLDKDIKNATGD